MGVSFTTPNIFFWCGGVKKIKIFLFTRRGVLWAKDGYQTNLLFFDFTDSPY